MPIIHIMKTYLFLKLEKMKKSEVRDDSTLYNISLRQQKKFRSFRFTDFGQYITKTAEKISEVLDEPTFYNISLRQQKKYQKFQMNRLCTIYR